MRKSFVPVLVVLALAALLVPASGQDGGDALTSVLCESDGLALVDIVSLSLGDGEGDALSVVSGVGGGLEALGCPTVQALNSSNNGTRRFMRPTLRPQPLSRYPTRRDDQHRTERDRSAVVALKLRQTPRPRSARPTFIWASADTAKPCHCMCINTVPPVVA